MEKYIVVSSAKFSMAASFLDHGRSSGGTIYRRSSRGVARVAFLVCYPD